MAALELKSSALADVGLGKTVGEQIGGKDGVGVAEAVAKAGHKVN